AGGEAAAAGGPAAGDEVAELSRAGNVLGTPAYMSPEQARGAVAEVDQRSDVFALGSMLCEVLTGRPAYLGRTRSEVLRRAGAGGGRRCGVGGRGPSWMRRARRGGRAGRTRSWWRWPSRAWRPSR